jgi:hypothetical protein
MNIDLSNRASDCQRYLVLLVNELQRIFFFQLFCKEDATDDSSLEFMVLVVLVVEVTGSGISMVDNKNVSMSLLSSPPGYDLKRDSARSF